MKWAEEAGATTLEYFRRRDLKSVTKQNDFDVLTEADKASERIIIESIRRTYPTHSILSEEGGTTGSATGTEWQWVIDPIDGTTNFKNGLPIFSISIALQHNGESVAGVVYAPYLREMFRAYKGGGAYLNGKPIECTRNTKVSTMVVSTGMTYDRDVNPDNNLDNIARVCTLVRGIRRTGSAAIDLSYIAAGYFDIYWELDLKLWDIAAGQLMVSEAGAVMEYIPGHRGHSVIAGSRESLDVFRHLVK